MNSNFDSIPTRIRLAFDQLRASFHGAIQVEENTGNPVNLQPLEERIMMSASPMLAPDAGAEGFVATGESQVGGAGNKQETTTDWTDTDGQSAVATNSNGDYVVVYTEDGVDDVFLRRFDSTGMPLGDPFEISAGLLGEHRNASVSMAEDGRFVVVWENGSFNGESIDDSENSIYFQLFNADGSKNGDVTQVNTGAFSDGAQFGPDVSINDSGKFAVIYDGAGPSVSQNPFIATFNADGSEISGPVQVNQPFSGGFLEFDGSVVLTNDDRVVAAWSDEDIVRWNVFDLSLQQSLLPGGESTVALPGTTGSGVSNPSLAVNDNGLVAIAVEVATVDGTGNEQSNIAVQLFDLNSNTIGPLQQTVLAGDQSNPELSWGSDDVLIVTFDGEGAGDDDGVFARQYEVIDSGSGPIVQAVGQDILVNETTDNAQFGSSVAAINGENFVVVWNSEDGNVLARQFGTLSSVDLTGSVVEEDFVDDGNGVIQRIQQDVFAGANVLLYRDDGDGVIDADDKLVQETVTDSEGNYRFTDLIEGRKYYVVVDARSLQNSSQLNGDYHFDDTFADQVSSNGMAKIGGLEAGVSDDASSLTTSQHVTSVIIGNSDVADVDFGFSYNVVTNVSGGDLQDDDASDDHLDADDPLRNERSVQGSLRQFITNANALAGGNDLHFVPGGVDSSVTSGVNSFWEIAITSALPTITDAETVIDGRAYDVDGVTRLNTNTAILGDTIAVGTGTDGVVGTDDEHVLSGVEAVELEIFAAVSEIRSGLTIDAADVEVGYVSIHGFGLNNRFGGNIEVIAGGDRAYIHDNILGASAESFTLPASFSSSAAGIAVIGADGGLIENNLIGFVGAEGIRLAGLSNFSNGADNWVVNSNEIRSTALVVFNRDGISNLFSSNLTATNNLIVDSRGFGVDTFRTTGEHTIANNSIFGNGVGGSETGGVRIYGDDSLVRHNHVAGNQGAGVVVVGNVAQSSVDNPATGNLISQNAFDGNSGISIDLVSESLTADLNRVGDGISLNDVAVDTNAGNEGFDQPVLQTVLLSDDSLAVIGTFSPDANIDFIELYLANPGGGDFLAIPEGGFPAGQAFGEGAVFLGTLDAAIDLSIDANGEFTAILDTPVEGWPVAVNQGAGITAIAIEAVTGNTSEFSNVEFLERATVALPSNVTALEDTPYVFQVSDFQNDLADPGLTLDHIDIATDVTQGTLTLDGNPVSGITKVLISQIANGELQFLPTADASGTGFASFEFSVNDGRIDSNTALLNIDVTPVNDAPVVADSTHTIDEDAELVVGVDDGLLSGATDIEMDSLTVNATLVSDVSNGVLQFQPDGTFTYRPDADFHGTDSFTYTVDDGNGGSDEATVEITVNPLNDAPEFVGPSVIDLVEDGAAVELELTDLFTDVDIDDTLGLGVVSADPELNVAVDDVNGTLTVSSAVDATGVFEIIVSGTDSEGEVTTSTISVDVAPVNDDPVVADSTHSINEDTLLVVGAEAGLLSAATDIDMDDTLTVNATLVSDVNNGTLDFQPDGSFTYRPDPDFHGTDSLTYTVDDGNGGSVDATVEITVNPINDAPEFIGPSVIDLVEDGAAVELDLADLFTDIDTGDTLNLGVVSADPELKVAVDDVNGTLTVSSAVDATGVFEIIVSGTDSEGEVTTSTISVDVAPVNDDPVVADSTHSINEDTLLVVGAEAGLLSAATDIDMDDTLTVNATLVSDVNNGTLDFQPDGSFTYQPDADFNGTDSFTYSVDDGNGGSDEATVEITVSPVNDAPEFIGPSVINLVEDGAAVEFDWTEWFTDIDVDDTLDLDVVGTADPFLNFTIDEVNGTLTLTTDTNAIGISEIEVSATDSAGMTTTSSIQVDVSPTNDTVTTEDQQLQTEVTRPVTGNLLANTTDVDGEALTIIVTDSSSAGELTINPDGTFVFNPDGSTLGETSFSFVASDGVSLSNESTVTIELLESTLIAPAPVAVVTEPAPADSTNESNDSEENDEEFMADPFTGGTPEQSDGATSNANSSDGLGDSEGGSEEDGLVGTEFELFRQQQEDNVIFASAGRGVGESNFTVAEYILNVSRDASLGLANSIATNLVAEQGILWRELDAFRNSSDAEAAFDSIAIGSVGTVSSGLIVGYVVWALRSGLLMSSIVASMPVWNMLDPMAIVSVSDAGENREDESLQDIVDSPQDST